MGSVSEDDLPPKVVQLCQPLKLTEAQSKEIMDKFLADVNLGLSAKTRKKATVKCLPTYVQDFPTGQEEGKFLALDLGGTNFRVLLVTLAPDNFDMQSKIYEIPKPLMKSKAPQLFDHIATCLADFMKENALEDTPDALPLGFTFSFPLVQQGLTQGILERWTKGFKVKHAVGKDVVKLLEEAMQRRGDIKIKVCAVLNDTTGTLMSCAWKNPKCKIGLIIGTGTNCCYVEKVENVEGFDGDLSKPYVIINCESGGFGDKGCLNFIRTKFDKEVDKHSINKGKQVHEKMISGMYLGELVRLLLIKLVKEKVLFPDIKGKVPKQMKQWELFTTKHLTDIQSDEPGEYANVKSVVETVFGVTTATEQDFMIIRYVCELFVLRAANIVAAVLATLVNKIGEEDIVIGVDGSIYRFYPAFHDLLVNYMTPLVTPGIQFDLMLSEDGSGRGAALVAAVAEMQKFGPKEAADEGEGEEAAA